jgi:hypothetical protein
MRGLTFTAARVTVPMRPVLLGRRLLSPLMDYDTTLRRGPFRVRVA